jgi:hypothetical protein
VASRAQYQRLLMKYDTLVQIIYLVCLIKAFVETESEAVQIESVARMLQNMMVLLHKN